MKALLLCAFAAVLIACSREADIVAAYDSAPAMPREIAVAVEAAGVIEPVTTVEVKSKASGEILMITGDTGDLIEEGALLVQIDQRTPRNRFAQAEAELTASEARLTIAQSQMQRAAKLLSTATFTESDYEQIVLEHANAQAQVVTGQVNVENARIALDDTDVRAPITGTIIEKLVEKGQVISSPTQDVGGGTLLMKMADLTTVQVRALVDETDIGKIRVGMSAQVTVAAYPNQPFPGEVLKIEPQAFVDQNVTMFAVLITLDNDKGLLLPGMNTNVEITIAERQARLAIPTIALRTQRDIHTSAFVMGISSEALKALLDKQRAQAHAAATPPDTARKRRKGSRNAASSYQFGGNYWVFSLREGLPYPVPVRTGITDLSYSEVLSGLSEGDEVFLLPSSDLLEQQERIQRYFRRRFGGGVPGIAQR